MSVRVARARVRRCAATVTTKRYYTHAAITVAVRDSAGSGSLNYLLGDQLGSTTVSVNASGGTPVVQRYLPYGAPRSTTGGSAVTDRGWIGQTKDASTGLQYLNARYYDPAIGRFTAVDPVVGVSRPGSVDRYGYSLDNPVSMSDPTGLCPAEVCPRGQQPAGLGDPAVGYDPGGGSTPLINRSQGDVFEDDGVSLSHLAGSGAEHAGGVFTWWNDKTSRPWCVVLNCDDRGEDPRAALSAFAGDAAKEIGPGTLNEMLRLSLLGRAPDYVVVEGSAFSHFFGLGGGGFGVFTRSGKLYLAPEGGVGTPGGAVTVRAGWILQGNTPSNSEVDHFVSGWAVTASANGAGAANSPAVAVNWATNWDDGVGLNDFSVEGGGTVVGSAGISLTGSYSFEVTDTDLSWSG